MLFAAIYRTKESLDEDRSSRALRLFQAWQPPLEFKAHLSRVDGNGGVALVESESAMKILEAIQPFTPYFKFEVVPVVDIKEAVPVMDSINKWRQSIK